MSIPLPTELVEGILDHLYDDHHTLITCGLVSRLWLSASRSRVSPKVFRDIRFTHLQAERAKRLQALVQGETCSISFRHLVRSLEFHGLSTWPRMSKQRDNSEWVLDIILGLLPILPATTSLFLDSFNITGESIRQLIPPLMGSFIVELALHAVEFTSLSHAIELVSALPSLEVLSFHDVTWDDSFVPAPASNHNPGSSLASLRRLHLGDCYKRDLIDWFMSQRTVPTVHDLQLGDIHPMDAPAVGDYLRLLGPTLQNLCLTFFSFDSGGDAEDFFAVSNLEKNFGLRSLCFDKFIHYSDYQFSSAVPWIIEMLREIRSPALDKVILVIYLSHLDDLVPQEDPIDWPKVDALFQEENLVTVGTLLFDIRGTMPADFVIPAILVLLPQCDQRGILQFTSHNKDIP